MTDQPMIVCQSCAANTDAPHRIAESYEVCASRECITPLSARLATALCREAGVRGFLPSWEHPGTLHWTNRLGITAIATPFWVEGEDYVGVEWIDANGEPLGDADEDGFSVPFECDVDAYVAAYCGALAKVLAKRAPKTINQDSPSAQSRLSVSFAAWVRHFVGDNLDKVVAENKGSPDGTCASGDYCDSNMAMFFAFQEVFGRDMVIGYDTPDEERMADEDMNLAQRAWSDAKRRGFKDEPWTQTVAVRILQFTAGVGEDDVRENMAYEAVASIIEETINPALAAAIESDDIHGEVQSMLAGHIPEA